jgi:broad specificity phosphatase PhoE
MPVIRWWWLRHAPTGAKGAIGWHDLPADLSDHARLDHLSVMLPQMATVVSSDLARARATADRILQGRRRLPDEPGLREIHFGDWEGLDFDTIAARFPTDSARWWAEPGPARATGGESFDALAARVAAAIDCLHGKLGAPGADGHDIVAVAHMGSILAALACATGMAPRQVLGFKIDTLSLTRLDWLPEAKAWRVVCVNTR